MGLDARKPVLSGLRTAKAQTSLRSLISAFVIRLMESIISRLAASEISYYLLIFVAEQAGLNLTVGNPETGFVATRPIL